MDDARQRLDNFAARAASELISVGAALDTLTSTKFVTVSRRRGFLGLSQTQVEETRIETTTPGWKLLEEPYEALTEYKMYEAQRSRRTDSSESRESLWLTPVGEIHIIRVTSSTFFGVDGPRISTRIAGTSAFGGSSGAAWQPTQI